jgi:hypothetical protein
MTITLTTQQVTYFGKNGFLELEALFSPVEATKYHVAILETLEKRKDPNPIAKGRDLWRDSPTLKNLVCSRKLTKIALQATGKPSLCVGLDQWYPPSYSQPKPEKIKDFLCIQGILCAMLIQFQPGTFEIPAKTSPLGLLPFPKGQGNALLVQPGLLLNWPSISTQLGLYLVAYAAPTAVYIRNPKDPAGEHLKRLGLEYGDRLTNETHPTFS